MSGVHRRSRGGFHAGWTAARFASYNGSAAAVNDAARLTRIMSSLTLRSPLGRETHLLPEEGSLRSGGGGGSKRACAHSSRRTPDAMQCDGPGGVPIKVTGWLGAIPPPLSLLSSRSARLRRFALLPRWGWQFEVPIWGLRHRLAPPAGRSVATSRAAGVK